MLFETLLLLAEAKYVAKAITCGLNAVKTKSGPKAAATRGVKLCMKRSLIERRLSIGTYVQPPACLSSNIVCSNRA